MSGDEQERRADEEERMNQKETRAFSTRGRLRQSRHDKTPEKKLIRA